MLEEIENQGEDLGKSIGVVNPEYWQKLDLQLAFDHNYILVNKCELDWGKYEIHNDPYNIPCNIAEFDC